MEEPRHSGENLLRIKHVDDVARLTGEGGVPFSHHLGGREYMLDYPTEHLEQPTNLPLPEILNYLINTHMRLDEMISYLSNEFEKRKQKTLARSDSECDN